jgi:primary-amine oxidase
MTPGNYSENYITQRNPLKPLEITQSEGPNFQVWFNYFNFYLYNTLKLLLKVDGQRVVWADSWDFRVGFNAREGLILHDIRFLEHPVQPNRSPPSTTPSTQSCACPSNSGNITKESNKERPALITRPVFFRASMCEMTVPYGDPRPQHYRKNAFDAGEYLFFYPFLLPPFCIVLFFF